MARHHTALADLFTAAGTSFAAANTRLAAAGAPALLRDASLTLEFHGGLAVRPDGLAVRGVAQPGVQQLALSGRQGRMVNTTLTVTLMAAPAVRGPAT